ncbi:MAG TPA: prepilin-type N-terminal cleavage/methylation domain-containing protein [Tepidisphaeraceae bacterium]|nr:prepilin-type N-terminal cleavage/methylation domain-containing protein [Tepidisphaeraceae bacterium]
MPPCPRAFPRAFTLIEVLVVIGIIVLLIALAVPALSVITGSNSINGAENNISAMLGRARGDAIALQKDTGVLFFIDPATQGVMMAEVQAVAGTAAGIQTMLDLVPDRDFVALPKGVYVQTIDNTVISTANVRQDDAYIGFNRVPDTTPPGASTTQFGGVILFDATGKLVSRSYAFRSQQPSGEATAIFNLLYRGKAIPDTSNPVTETANFIPANNRPSAASPMVSAYGMILFDRDAFSNNGNLEDPQAQPDTIAYNTGGEPAEENWLDENGTPLMVNRYNGTLVRGE